MPGDAATARNNLGITPANIGAAPTGYGLGGTATAIDTFDNATKFGLYVSNQGIPEGEKVYWTCLVLPHNENYILQIAYRSSQNPSSIALRRKHNTDGWQPWEHLNPAMAKDNIYRTVERYTGKAVYKKIDTDGIVRYQLEGESTWHNGIPGAAPAGYGLGWAQSLIAYNGGDLDALTAPGWYYWNAQQTINIAGVSSQYWYIHVIAYGDGHLHCKQELNAITRNFTGSIRRKMSGSTWGEWEWDFPPMEVGVEYRTIERWGSAAVYKKRVDHTLASDFDTTAGGDAAGISIRHGIESFGSLVGCMCTMVEGDSNILLPTRGEAGQGDGYVYSVDETFIHIMFNNFLVTAGTKFCVNLAYTKK